MSLANQGTHLPRPRCPHGYLAVVVEDQDGWQTPTSPVLCRLCRDSGWSGLKNKPGQGEHVDQVPVPAQVLVECSKPGCGLIVVQGVDHESDCLLIDEGPWPDLNLGPERKSS